MAEKRESKAVKAEPSKPFEKANVDISTIYKPAFDSLLVEMIIADKTAAGIILPDQSRSKDRVQKVLAVGPDCKTVKKGDLILVSPACRPFQIPLIYDEHAPIQHIQIKEYEVAGVVDPSYSMVIATAKSQTSLTVN